MDAIDLMLDEENDLTFQLDVEGTRPGSVECRLMIEAGDMSLIFNADRYKGEEVNVTLPPLDHVLKEGEYDMTLEVLVDDRRFIPLSLSGNFEKGDVKVGLSYVNQLGDEMDNLAFDRDYVSANVSYAF